MSKPIRMFSVWALMLPVLIGTPIATLSQTLAETIDQALLLRTETAVATLDRRAAQAKWRVSRARELPRLDLTVSNDITSLVDPFTGITVTADVAGTPVTADVTRSVPRAVLGANLRLSYPLYTGGRNTANSNAAQFELAQSDARAVIVAGRIARSVALAWFAVHRANLSAMNLQQTIALQARQAALTQIRVRRGLSARIDGEAAQSESRRLAAELVQRRAERSARWISLSQERGLAEIPLEPDWNTYTRTDQLGASIARLRQYAPANALAQENNALVNAARERLVAEHAANKPSVSLFAQYNAIGRSEDNEWFPFDQVRRSDLIVGARLEWNLFEGYAAQARIDQRAAELARSERRQAQALQARQFETASARANLNARQAALTALSTQISLLERQIEIARVRVQSGRGDERAILKLQRERTGLAGQIRIAQLDLLDAQTRQIFARALPKVRVSN